MNSRWVALYARVSTEEQAQHGTSLDVQLAECRALAMRVFGEEVELRSYVDAGVSGTTLDREALGRLRQDAAQGCVKAVVCHDPDRLSRHLGQLLQLMEELGQNGVDVRFVNFDLVPSADGRLLFAIRGAIAEFEAQRIRQRMTLGKLARAREGRPVGGGQLIYGYRYDPATKRFLLEPAEAEVVRTIFRWAQEHGTWEIARRLNEQGLRAKRGGPWTQASVYGILRNPTYLGRMAQMGGTGYVEVPALVDPTTFARVAARLSGRRNRPPGPARHPYLLTGRLRCGLCGSRMGGGYGRPGKAGYRTRYACAGKRRSPPCPSHYYPADLVDRAVWEALLGLLSPPPHRLTPPSWRASQDAPSLRQLQEELAALSLRRRRLLQAYRDGILEEEVLAEQLSPLEAARRLLLQRLVAERDAPGEGEDEGRWWLGQARMLWRHLSQSPSLEDRRLVLEALGAQVVLGPKEEVRVLLHPSLPGPKPTQT